MPEAHDSNDSGIQHFSATQSSEQVASALATAYPDKYEYEKQDFTTTPLQPPTEGTPQQLDANGNIIPPPVAPVVDPPIDSNAPPKRVKPGRRERELAREVRARDEQIQKLNESVAELRGMVIGKQSAAPPVQQVAPEPVVVADKPVERATPPPVEAAKFEKPRPKREDFFDAPDPEAAYEDAFTDWKLEGRDFNRKAADDAAKANEQREDAAKVQQTVEQEWQASLTTARAEFTDFDEVIKKPHFEDEEKTKPFPIVNNAMMHVARNSETGAKILYWLGTHPKEANEIAVKTFIKDVSDTRAVEKSIRMIHKEFDKIEADLAANPPNPKAEPVTQVAPPAEVDDEYDDETDDDELATDPNLQPVSGDPAAGKQVEQAPARGTVDTKPQAGQQQPVQQAQPKPEPVSRVGSRGHSANRPVVALPPEAVRELPPVDYRARRKSEGSSAAIG